MTLPAMPAPDLLADLSRETAAAERVDPEAVEKDFYLTRLLGALAEELGESLLLKGGTLLSKVDLGFLRCRRTPTTSFPARQAESGA